MNIPETYFRQAQITWAAPPESPTVAQNNLCAWMCADRAARVFAPAALDHVGSHDLADRLREAPPIVNKQAAIELRRIMGPVPRAAISALREAARACDPKATHEIRALAAGRLAVWGGDDLAVAMINVCRDRAACPMCGYQLQHSGPSCDLCGTLL